MRLNYLDILEQCFRNKFFGYDREDVDTFLHLVADDFKEMAEELETLKKKIELNDQSSNKSKEQHHQRTEEVKKKVDDITPTIIREKAKRIINAARKQASQHKEKAEQELSALRKEINKIKQEKVNLVEETKSDTH